MSDRIYTSEASVGLYPVAGAQSDYAYGRHIANSVIRKTYGFTLETGPWMGNAQTLSIGGSRANQA